jgi:hypothetical protein
MGFQVSPGVRVTEVDFTTIVPAVATSLGGIAGNYEWGPANKVTLVDSPRSYRDTFGGPKNWNFEQWFSGANFLNYTNSLQVVRVVSPNAKNASAGPAGASGVFGLDNEDKLTSEMNGIIARYPGEMGNSLKVTIFSAAEESLVFEGSLSGPSAGFTENFDKDSIEYGLYAVVMEDGGPISGDLASLAYGADLADTPLGVGVTAFAKVFSYVDGDTGTLTVKLFNDGGQTDASSFDSISSILDGLGGSAAINFVNSTGKLAITGDGGAYSYLKATSVTESTVTDFSNWKETVGSNEYTYYSNFGYEGEGAPESTTNIQTLADEAGTTFATNDQIHVLVVDEDGKFTGSPYTVLEKFANVSVLPEARLEDGSSVYWKNIINERSKYIIIGGNAFPAKESWESDFVAQSGMTFSLSSETDITGGYGYKVNWGKQQPIYVSLTGGIGQTSDALVDSNVPSANPYGYNIFEDTETVDVNFLISGAITDSNSVGSLKKIAELRRDCIAFFSPANKSEFDSEDEKLQRCLDFKTTIGSSSYCVIDSGYKYQYDPYNDLYRWVPLNADVAGLCARTEVLFDAWFSPAGYNRGQIRNLVKLAFNPTKAFRDKLYPEGINPIISTPGEGTLLFGDRTALSKPSAFDRINVRRLFIVLQKAISTAAKFSLFEFNDDFTRSRFVSLVTPFLRDVQSRRGIIDFKVVCNEGNNTAEVIDRNEFVADIYIKPNRSINFIQLNFIATRTDASFNELGA